MIPKKSSPSQAPTEAMFEYVLGMWSLCEPLFLLSQLAHVKQHKWSEEPLGMKQGPAANSIVLQEASFTISQAHFKKKKPSASYISKTITVSGEIWGLEDLSTLCPLA